MRKSLLVLLTVFLCCGNPSGKELPPPMDYASLKSLIREKQLQFRTSYETATAKQKDSIINASREFVFSTIVNDIFPNWYGTPWSFYGHTKTPKDGSIACGYFVNTVLEDAGFNIPGDDWAKLASETFIVKLTGDLKRFHKQPIAQVIEYVKKRGDGLYLVGLDCHVGFIYVKDDEIKFVHSNYYQKETGVMAEEPDTKNPLNDSKYRILGKLFSDEMMQKWVTGQRYR